MTAGVIAMNSGAAVIAADSAVSIRLRRGAKHYQGASKIICLHRDDPVGVFWYGSAEYMGVPWEVLLKEFRAQSTVSFTQLEEYADALWSFVDAELPNWNVDADGDPGVNNAITALLDQVETAIEYLPADGREAAVQRVIEKWKESRRPVARVLADDEVSSRDNLWNWFNNRLDNLESEWGTLNGDAREQLRGAALEAWTRISARDPDHSGVVIVGYGTSNRMPSMCHFLIAPPASGLARRVGAKPVCIDANRPAVIVPFAQNDLVRLFMEGIHPNINHRFTGILERLQVDYGIPGEVIELLSDRIASEIDRHGRPVIEAVRFLPKADLAEFARSLVRFTAFRLKMSLAEESVAEPIDVAVISRSDGLVWVHRTHYFGIENNPHFAQRYR